jgi:hypothetical protein
MHIADSTKKVFFERFLLRWMDRKKTSKKIRFLMLSQTASPIRKIPQNTKITA